MELKVVGKRGFGLFRRGNQKQRSWSSTSVLEGIAKANGGGGRGGAVVSCKEEDGVVRMRIVVKKTDLKQLIHAMNGGARNCPTAEQRLNALRKKHISKGNAANRSSKCWSPALYSIPEEEL